ncbi:MAG: threonylcarbamoyl-AMP synthase [Acidobacteria bacterium]|nr:threonylcarbamoyl-AMP synthase [Acidobacteriota bacterium]
MKQRTRKTQNDTQITETLLTKSPAEAAGFIKRGEVAAFPTETVYGLGADLFNAAAIEKIFAAKGRPQDNPLIAHISSNEEIWRVAREVPPTASRLIEVFFPGPLTLVLPKDADVPPIATAGLDTIGVRRPRHPLAQELLRACRTPLVAPSANLSGRPSPTTWQAVQSDLGGRIACILQGEPTEIGLESTVVDCTGEQPLVLRAGAVTLEQLQAVIPETRLAGHDPAAAPKSPGLKHRHYAPQARIRLIDRAAPGVNTNNSGYIGLNQPEGSYKLVRVCGDTAEYARELFEFFRECDRAGVAEIHCQRVGEEGLGLALMDRLRRASQAGER